MNGNVLHLLFLHTLILLISKCSVIKATGGNDGDKISLYPNLDWFLKDEEGNQPEETLTSQEAEEANELAKSEQQIGQFHKIGSAKLLAALKAARIKGHKLQTIPKDYVPEKARKVAHLQSISSRLHRTSSSSANTSSSALENPLEGAVPVVARRRVVTRRSQGPAPLPPSPLPKDGNSNRKKRGATDEEAEMASSNNNQQNKDEILDSEMHRVIDELARESHPMLYFRIDHNPANFQTTSGGAASLDKAITVRIIKAVNLPAMDKNGLNDPFVQVLLVSGIDRQNLEKDHSNDKLIMKTRTKTEENTLDPVFNESLDLIFSVYFDYEGDDGDLVVCEDGDDEIEGRNKDGSLFSKGRKCKNPRNLPYYKWTEIVIKENTKPMHNLVHSPMVKVAHQNKIFDALIAMESETRYETLLAYCNNRWSILGVGTSPFLDSNGKPIGNVLDVIKKGMLTNFLDATAQELKNYYDFWHSNSDEMPDLKSLSTNMTNYRECVKKMFTDKGRALTLAPLEMSEHYRELMEDLMYPTQIYLAKQVLTALTKPDLPLLMELASTLDTDDLAMVTKLVQLLYSGDQKQKMDFNTLPIRSAINKLPPAQTSNSIFNQRPRRQMISLQENQEKVLNFLYWRFHGDERRRQKIEDAYIETEKELAKMVQKKLADYKMMPCLRYSLHYRLITGNQDAPLAPSSSPSMHGARSGSFGKKSSFHKTKSTPMSADDIHPEEYEYEIMLKLDRIVKLPAMDDNFLADPYVVPILITRKYPKSEEEKKKLVGLSLFGGSKKKEKKGKGASSSSTHHGTDADSGKEVFKRPEPIPNQNEEIKFTATWHQNDTLNPIFTFDPEPNGVVKFNVKRYQLAHFRLFLAIFDKDHMLKKDDRITDVEIPLAFNGVNYGNDLLRDMRPMVLYKLIREKSGKPMMIRLLRAKNLPETDTSLSDPRLRVKMDNQGHFCLPEQTRNTLNPIFNLDCGLRDQNVEQWWLRKIIFALDDLDESWRSKKGLGGAKNYESIGTATINQEFRQPQDVPKLKVCVYKEGEYVVKTLNKVEMAEIPKFYVEPNGLHPVTGLAQLYYMGDPEEQGINPKEFGIQIALIYDQHTGLPYPIDFETKRQIVLDPSTCEPFEISIRDNEAMIFYPKEHGKTAEQIRVPIERLSANYMAVVDAEKQQIYYPIAAKERLWFENFVDNDQLVHLALDPFNGNKPFMVTHDPLTGHAVNEFAAIVQLERKWRKREMQRQEKGKPELKYELNYEQQKGILNVRLLNGSRLPNKDDLGKSDPYAVLYLLPSMEHIGKTAVIHDNLNPQFNWEFQLKIPNDELNGCALLFHVFDHDLTKKDDKMGYAIVDLGAAKLSNAGNNGKSHTVELDIDKLGIPEYGLRLAKQHRVAIGGRLEFRTYYYMSQDEQLQRRYFQTLLMKTLKKLTSFYSSIKPTFVGNEGADITRAYADLHRVLVSRYDYDLNLIVQPETQRLAKLVDNLCASVGIAKKVLAITQDMAKIERVPESRPYRAAIRKLMNLENKDVVGYDEFLNKFGFFLKDFMEELNPSQNYRRTYNNNNNNGEFTFKMVVSKDDRLLKLVVTNSKDRLSDSIFLHSLINDLNQSIINQADLRFRKAFRKLANGKMRVGDLVKSQIKSYGTGRYGQATNHNGDIKDAYYVKNDEDVIRKMQEVLTALVIAHNKALAIVLHCMAKPYAPLWTDPSKKSADDDHSQPESSGRKAPMASGEQQQQQQQEEELNGFDNVDGNRMDPDEEERYLAELKSPVDLAEEKRVFGIHDDGKFDFPGVNLSCPPFNIDVPVGAWEGGSSQAYQERAAKEIATQIVETHIKKAIFDQTVIIEASRERGSSVSGDDHRYTYAIGRAMMQQLGFTTDANQRDPIHPDQMRQTRHDVPQQMAQRIMDDIGAMVEKKHNQLMGDSDENFVFEQLDFGQMNLNLGEKNEQEMSKYGRKFHRFVKKCFIWLNNKVELLHSKAVRKKNRMARYYYKWIYSFLSRIRGVMTGQKTSFTFILQTFFPALYYGKKLIGKLGKLLAQMARNVFSYMGKGGRAKMRGDLYKLMTGMRQVFHDDKWKKFEQWAEATSVHGHHNKQDNKDGAAENTAANKAASSSTHGRNNGDFFIAETLDDAEFPTDHGKSVEANKEEEELFNSLGSLVDIARGNNNKEKETETTSAASFVMGDLITFDDGPPPAAADHQVNLPPQQQQQQHHSLRLYNFERMESMDWQTMLDQSVQNPAPSSSLQSQKSLLPVVSFRTKRENLQNPLPVLIEPSQTMNSTQTATFDKDNNNIDDNAYFSQQQKRSKRKGGFAAGHAAGYAGKSATKAAVYSHAYSSPSVFMPSYRPGNSYTYIYVDNNDGYYGHGIDTHKTLLTLGWTGAHFLFFFMVTRPVHKDMKYVNCSETNGFLAFSKSFLNHLFFKYIKGIYYVGKLIFKIIRGKYKREKAKAAQEYTYMENSQGPETGRTIPPARVPDLSEFIRSPTDKQKEAYKSYLNDCGRIYSGLLIFSQIIIWLGGIIVILAAF